MILRDCFSGKRQFGSTYKSNLGFLFEDGKKMFEQGSEDEKDSFIRSVQAGRLNGSELESYGFMNPFLKTLRVLCLSRRHDATLMWSHYSDQHRGVVLGFDSTILNKSLRVACGDVKYYSNFPEVFDGKEVIESMILDNPLSPKRRLDWLLVKHDDWSYEKEVRYVRFDLPLSPDGSTSVEFPSEALKEIYYGIKTDEHSRKCVWNACRDINKTIRSFVMKASTDSFSVVSEPDWPLR